MRVLLTGTSNAIIANGINKGLATDPRVSAFCNVSYGASGSVAIGDHLGRIDFTQHDVCVIDYCVNDEDYVVEDGRRLDDSLSNIHALVDTASRAGCLPIVVIFPDRRRLTDTMQRAFGKTLVQQLRPLGVPILDLYTYIENIENRHGIARADLFLDEMHLHRQIGQFIGAEIVDYVTRQDPDQMHLRLTDHWFRRLRFVPPEALSVEGACDGQIVQDRSALLTRRLLHVAPRSRLICRPRRQVELAGISFNAARSWGVLHDSATRAEVMRTRYLGLFKRDRPLTMVGWPMGRKLRSDGEPFVLEYDAAPVEGTDRPPPAIQIAGLILRDLSSRHRLSVLGLSNPPHRIEDQIDLTREADMIAALRRTIARHRSPDRIAL